MDLSDLAPFIADEDKAIAYVESLRWHDGVAVCPHCETKGRAYRLKGKSTRKGLWKCGACRKQFTVRIGSIFEDSPIPLGKWVLAIHLMCSSKKGISSHQIKRELGISYQSAWFLTHRIRFAMTKEPLASLLGSEGQIVEIDETYIGGEPKNNLHKGYKRKKKAIALTLVERDGDVRSLHIRDRRRSRLHDAIRQNVQDTAHIITDSAKAYPGIGKYYWWHDTINHSKEFVRGIIHTNFAESYHSLVKRGIIGTYHHVSEKHLPRYLNEFAFRWNSRKATDGARTAEAIIATEGKRLYYRDPVVKH